MGRGANPRPACAPMVATFAAMLLIAVLSPAQAARPAGAGLPSPMKYELYPYRPAASPASVVASSDGTARFTVLTDCMIRMERTATPGSFEDRPSLAFVNRFLPETPKFTASEAGGVLTITTAALKLTYTVGAPFAAGTLGVVSTEPKSAFERWQPGDTSGADPGNLLGTFRTLDRVKVLDLNCSTAGAGREWYPEHCAFGLVSRSGWALVDDSQGPVLDSEDWWADADGAPYSRRGVVDWYLLAHGHAYKQALRDYSLVGGSVPLIPRWAHGVWWTRWYNFASVDVREAVESFEAHSMPLDVFVLDMNWHKKDSWTGYSFDRSLLPFPEDLLGVLRRKGLHVGANLHDAEGVGAFEDAFPQVAERMGLPAGAAKAPLDLANRTFVEALEDAVLLPLEDAGISFWWTDWQQGEAAGGLPGGALNPTIVLNKIRSTDRKRRGGTRAQERPVVMGRWGGLGNHRYQVGFSGDVDGLTWETLAFQPYFTLTASNVGFSQWTHDICGPGGDHELYARWVQWGALSGVMRMHDRGLSAGACKDPWPTAGSDQDRCAIVEPWNTPRLYEEANRAALLLRAELVPHLYTLALLAFDSGVPALRPLYYEWPNEEMAYSADKTGAFAQFMLGEDLMAAPVVTPSDGTSMANSTIWVPPGAWVEVASGEVRAGGGAAGVLSKHYDVSEVPLFVREGGVVATARVRPGGTTGTAGRIPPVLVFSVYGPGAAGAGAVYEDDGTTQAYAGGEAGSNRAWTRLAYTRWGEGGRTLSLSITPEGSFQGMPLRRAYQIRLVNTLPPARVAARHVPAGEDRTLSRFFGAGPALPYSRDGGPGTWTYDGSSMTTIIELAAAPAAAAAHVTVIGRAAGAAGGGERAACSGVKGLLRHAVLAKRALDETWSAPGTFQPQPNHLGHLAAAGDALSYLAGDPDPEGGAFMAALKGLRAHLQGARAELQGAAGPLVAGDPRAPPGQLREVDPDRLLYAATLLGQVALMDTP